jgi:hypothetical protein
MSRMGLMEPRPPGESIALLLRPDLQGVGFSDSLEGIWIIR